MTTIAVAIAAALVAVTFLVWMILRMRARQRDVRAQQRRTRQKGYRYAWDRVMGRKRQLMIEHHERAE